MTWLQDKLKEQGDTYHNDHDYVAHYRRYEKPEDCYKPECAANENALELLDQAVCQNCRHVAIHPGNYLSCNLISGEWDDTLESINEDFENFPAVAYVLDVDTHNPEERDNVLRCGVLAVAPDFSCAGFEPKEQQ